jgi:N-dimethylarginine dimethylaminohydrolase
MPAMEPKQALTPQVRTLAVTDTQLNPTRLDKPAYLLNFPFSLTAGEANNIWMEELPEEKRQINLRIAIKQFMELYHFMAGEALVYLLPASALCGLQDLVYTANLGIVLEHVSSKNTVVLSNFTSEPRVGETACGARFFRAMGYDVHISPFKFEGEAELKHICDNVYIGGYGIRSQEESYAWMEETFGMEVIKVYMEDPYLYHLDCIVFPLTAEAAMVCTELLDKEEIAAIEQHVEIIDVSYDEACSGITNSVRLANLILNSSHLHELKAGTEDYQMEIAKNRRLEDIAVKYGFEVAFFNLSEYHKSGALLSCMVMHLNRNSYEYTLL